MKNILKHNKKRPSVRIRFCGENKVAMYISDATDKQTKRFIDSLDFWFGARNIAPMPTNDEFYNETSRSYNIYTVMSIENHQEFLDNIEKETLFEDFIFDQTAKDKDY